MSRPRLLAVVGVILIGQLYAPVASARSGLITEDAFPVNQIEIKIKSLDLNFKTKKQILEETSKSVAEAKEAADSVARSKDVLKNEVESLKAEVFELQDMFVTINRYDPDSAGNRYAPGNCTSYVKQMRPDIGNSWGNANTWYYSAAAAGFKVGPKAKIGAIATTTDGWAGHVAYVERVSRDGLWVTISEMNYGYKLYNMNTRTVYYTEFQYIYELD